MLTRIVVSLAVGIFGLSACEQASRSPLDSTNPPLGTSKPPTPSTGPATHAPPQDAGSRFVRLSAPAGNRPSARSITIDGYNAAILPNGRLLTPVGQEINVDAPKPFGLAVTPTGGTALTINSGASRFSLSLIKNLDGPDAERRATLKRINVNATFMGVVFSPDAGLYYASGGENGNIWIGNTATGEIIGSVNLNGPTHALTSSVANPFPDPSQGKLGTFRGSFPGNMALTQDGRFLYVVDQGNFSVQVIDTSRIVTGLDADKKIVDMNNFAAVVGNTRVGRYPFGITVAPGSRQLYVANVGVFQYSHLIPRGPERQPGPVGSAAPNPAGIANEDYPVCFPGAAYPDEVLTDKLLTIKKIDATRISTLPRDLQDPDGAIRCGYISGDRQVRIPALGDPNVDESSSVYVLDITAPQTPRVVKKLKPGVKIGEVQDGIAATGGSHPNAVAVGSKAAYISNGNNDSISIVNTKTLEIVRTVPLAIFRGKDSHLKGLQPVSVVLSGDETRLYVAEAGINAVAVLSLSTNGLDARVEGHIPTGWWPSSVKLSADGKRLFVASAKGRGAPPNTGGEVGGDINGHPKHSVLGMVQVVDVPDASTLATYTDRVMINNGFVEVPTPKAAPGDPIPTVEGVASNKIKHVVFITKENLTHDLVLGDVLRTRKGETVNGDPRYALGYDGAPNHHELALQFAFSDNFYLEPTVSSDGHRWLVNNPTTEFEETHWPASYGGKRRDSGDNPEVIENWFGRIGFTDADASADPQDYPQHGNLWVHLARHGKTFLNFGEGHEFAVVDEDKGTEPTGIRQHVNAPMLKVLRDNTDHLYPQYNTTIPDSPLPEDPDRFNRFGRFQQVFNDRFVKDGNCTMPAFVNIYYPNDHGGGATDINGAAGPNWDFKRFVQDNDAALGLTVDLISKSPCWKDTVIFVTEDDTQSGLDHVDGYRTVFLAIGPFVKHEYVSKTHTSLASIFKTMDLILGLPPLNQYDAVATDLRDMFTSTPDMTPYEFVPPNIGVVKASWARLTEDIDFAEMDADEVSLRRAIMRSEGLPRKVSRPFRPAKAAKPIFGRSL